MATTLPRGGKGSKRVESDSLVRDTGGEDSPRNGKRNRTEGTSSSPSRPTPSSTKSSGSRSRRAIGDAQESLNSLLNPSADFDQPTVLSSSGSVRNPRGRIAGPTSPTSAPFTSRQANKLGAGSRSGAAGLIEGTSARSLDTDSDRMLAIVPGTHPLYGDDAEDLIRDLDASRSRIKVGLALANEHVQSARERVNLLISLDSAQQSSLGLGYANPADAVTLHTSRRQAARWVSRYATHLVVLSVVLALVAFGGLKTLTVQTAYPNGLHAVDAYTGTDHFHEAGEDGAADIDSMEYVFALPRTELGGTDAAANSRIYEAPAGPPQDAGQLPAVRTDVVAYTVQAGDTIESVATRFNLLPESVMGSNGIWDSEEPLAAGRVLQLPPVDGIYYVAGPGDTVDSVARRFQADPSLITSYGPNNVSGGALEAGRAIIVPGGMMPQRDSAITYVTRNGDTLKKVAARFGVDVPTILHANSIADPAVVPPGTSLRILPVAGMEYRTQTGDTVFNVADKFGVPAQNILDWTPNGVSAQGSLPLDKLILVPGGSPPAEVAAARLAASKETEKSTQGSQQPGSSRSDKPVQPTAKPKAEAAAPKPVAPKPAPKQETTYKGGSGRLGWPLGGFVITQYFGRRHNGLDLAAPAGTPLYAADSGKVIWAGWRRDGLGYCVFIDHLNGLTTVYGHMIRQPRVYVGQYVSRGQLIGNVGSTGRSTGPHVHFMVKSGGGYRNPMAYLGR